MSNVVKDRFNNFWCFIKRYYNFIITVIVLIFVVVSLFIISRAWFSNNTDVTSRGMSISVGTGDTSMKIKVQEWTKQEDNTYKWVDIDKIQIENCVPNQANKYRILADGSTSLKGHTLNCAFTNFFKGESTSPLSDTEKADFTKLVYFVFDDDHNGYEDSSQIKLVNYTIVDEQKAKDKLAEIKDNSISTLTNSTSSFNHNITQNCLIFDIYTDYRLTNNSNISDKTNTDMTNFGFNAEITVK